MIKKNILVTGSNGLLGQKIIYELVKRNNVNLIASSRGNNRLVNKSGYNYIDLDITNKIIVSAVKGIMPESGKLVGEHFHDEYNICETDEYLNDCEGWEEGFKCKGSHKEKRSTYYCMLKALPRNQRKLI